MSIGSSTSASEHSLAMGVDSFGKNSSIAATVLVIGTEKPAA